MELNMEEFVKNNDEFNEVKSEPITELKLDDGTTQKINTNLTFGEIKRAQAENILSREFHTRMMKVISSGKVEDMLDMEDAIACVYLSAKKGGFDKSRDSFEDLWVFDLEEAMGIYQQIMTKESEKSHAKAAFKKATKK